MKNGQFEKGTSKKSTAVISVLIAVILVALLVIALLLVLLLRDSGGETNLNTAPDSTIATEVEKNPDSIAIPGYEALTLKADSKEQTLYLPNPAQNTCYLQISLFLEDGTLLWQSELVEPGTNSEPIILEQALEQGTYQNALLHYSCFEMDKELTPLNGAEIKVTLRVK